MMTEPRIDKGEPIAQEIENHTETPLERPWDVVFSHPRLLAFAVLANIGPLMFGYDLVIVGAISALPSFLRDFGKETQTGLVLPAVWVGLWNGLVQAGGASGAIFAGFLQDRIGRRKTFLLGGILAGAGTTIAYVCGLPGEQDTRRGLFLLAKILIGMACGVLMSSCQTYVSEIAPKNLRGLVLGFYAFNVSLGHLMAIAIVFTQNSDAGPAAYRIPFATQWAFAGVAVIAAFILPESPVWLVAQDRLDKARAAMHRLGTDRDPSFLHRIQMTLNSEEDGTGRGGQMATFAECFQGRTDLRRTLVIVWLNILQQFVGMSLLTNAAYFLLMAGMSPKHALMVNLIGVASNMIANMATWYTAPRFGRRTIILFSIALDFFAWLAMGIAGCFDTAAANWFVGIALLLFGFFNSFGVASAVPIVAAEISCVRLRSKSQGIGFGAQCIMSWVFSFFTPYLYNTDEANWGGKIGFFFAGLSIIGYVVTWSVVPETKGRTFMELDWLFETGVRASRFRGAVVPTEGLGGGGEAKRVGAGQAESKEDF